MKILFFIFLGVAATGCRTRTDNLYCDSQTPCTDSRRSFCDLSGSLPGSDGIANTCIVDPSLVDAGLPDAPSDCDTSADCADGLPICSAAGECGQCQMIIDDLECEGRDSSKPLCAPNGECGECLSNSDCSTAQASICDVESFVCRGCEANSECESGACDKNNGQCIESSQIVYIDFASGQNNNSCGTTPGNACRRFAGESGALVKVSASRSTIVMAQVAHQESVAISGRNVLIVGEGATIELPSGVGGSTLSISSGASVVLDGAVVTGGVGLVAGNGINIVNSELRLVDTVIRRNESSGIFVSSSGLTILDSIVDGNTGDGIFAERSRLDIENTEVINNGLRGVFAAITSVDVRRSLIRQNRAGGIRVDTGAFKIENNFIVNNGNRNTSPSGPAGGIVVTNLLAETNQEIRHNTIVENEAPTVVASPGLVCQTTSQTVVDSNIVFGNNSNLDTPQTSGNCTVTYSNVQDTVSGTGNISVAPNFVSDSDFHLNLNSAGVNQANPNSPTTIDIDGQARPNAGQPDIGADEV